jgi:adenylate kinase
MQQTLLVKYGVLMLGMRKLDPLVERQEVMRMLELEALVELELLGQLWIELMHSEVQLH